MITLVLSILYTVLILVSNYYTFNFALKLGMRSNRKEGDTPVFSGIPGYIKPRVSIGKPTKERAETNRRISSADLPVDIIRKGDF